MDCMMSCKLLEKTVLVDGEPMEVYGLASFRVRPRRRKLGSICLYGLELIAKEDGKAIVAFCDDGVIDFYLKCGWYKIGAYNNHYIVSDHNLYNIEVEELW